VETKGTFGQKKKKRMNAYPTLYSKAKIHQRIWAVP